jgi:hypothetical protein
MVFQLFYPCANLQHSLHPYNFDLFFKTLGVGWPEMLADVETSGFSCALTI